MLNYQSTSFHDAMFVRKMFHLKPAPEFENWLMNNGWMDEKGIMQLPNTAHPMLQYLQS